MPKPLITKWCHAAYVEGWSICLWANPKLHVLCGNCGGPFDTRDYITVTNQSNEIAVFCPHCLHYNLTGLFHNTD